MYSQVVDVTLTYAVLVLGVAYYVSLLSNRNALITCGLLVVAPRLNHVRRMAKLIGN